MFTGLVGPRGHIVRREGQGDVRFTLATSWAQDSFVLGESIACDGACMTVIDWEAHALGAAFSFVASAESLAKTTLGDWAPGRAVNLERALCLGDALGGHLVSGHVDGLATLLSNVQENQSLRLEFSIPEGFVALVASKGSVTLNGVSLTVNDVSGAQFGVNLVPHTAEVTNLAALQPGDQVNFEADTLARYVARHMQLQGDDVS